MSALKLLRKGETLGVRGDWNSARRWESTTPEINWLQRSISEICPLGNEKKVSFFWCARSCNKTAKRAIFEAYSMQILATCLLILQDDRFEAHRDSCACN